MNVPASSFGPLLGLQARLYLNCLAGLNDQLAIRRVGDTNHMAFIALHLLDSRYVLARLIGSPSENPFGAILEHARGIDDVASFPSLEELGTDWRSLAPVITDHVSRLTSADLNRACPANLPILRIGEGSVADAIAFLVHHEAYHIGQMAYLRKLLGLPAMSYRYAARE